MSESSFTVPIDSPMGRWLLDGGGSDQIDCPLVVVETRALRSALPKPSTTPPMWAHDPTRSRRPKRKKNQPTRQGIA